MILNITFTHPEKIYKGNKTVTNSEGNVVRLSRQKWMDVCSWRNALQSCCWRAGGSPLGSGTTLSRGLPSLTLTASSSSFLQPDRVLPTSHGCPGRQKYKRSPRQLLHAQKPTCLCPSSVLRAWRAPVCSFGDLGWLLETSRSMIRPEVHPTNLSITLNSYCSFNSEALFLFSALLVMKTELKYWLNVHFTSQCQKALRSKKPYYWLKNRWYNIIIYFCAGRWASSMHLSPALHPLHRHTEEGHRWHFWA